MSYYIVDARKVSKKFPDPNEIQRYAGEALTEFLDTCEADDYLADEIKQELDADETLGYLLPVFNGKAPFVLTGDDDDE